MILVCGNKKTIDGSARRACRECGRHVWASPASLAAAGGESAEILCLACSRKITEPMTFTEEQVDEIAPVIGRRPSRLEIERTIRDAKSGPAPGRRKK